MILGKKSTSRQSVLERGRDSMENLSLSLTSLSSSPQRSATQPSSHLLMQKRTIEIKLVSFLVDQGLLIVLFVSVRSCENSSRNSSVVGGSDTARNV